MRVHHIECGTLCPPLGRFLVNARGLMVCHCLLVETPRDGLVLVDSGFGTRDVADPHRWCGPALMRFGRPQHALERTALDRVRALGFDPKDVRHIVPTHLDLDHAGGLVDFPWAEVHVSADEHRAAMRRATFLERERYQPWRWEHGPRWVLHEAGPSRREGEVPFFGLPGARAPIAGVRDDILIVPLRGHSRGHSGIAVRGDDGRWLLHAGDAYFFQSEVHEKRRRCSPGLDLFQTIVERDRRARFENQRRLRALARDQGADVRIFSAHDPREFDRERAASRTPSARVGPTT